MQHRLIIVNDVSQRQDTLDTLKFGASIEVKFMLPHHLLVICSVEPCFVLVDLEESLSKKQFIYRRVAETYKRALGRSLHVITITEFTNSKIPQNWTYRLTLRLFSPELELKTKYDYQFDKFFQESSWVSSPSVVPIIPPRAARYAKGRAPLLSVQKNSQVRAPPPVYTAEILKKGLLITKYFDAHRLSVSTFNLSKSSNWSVSSSIEITNDAKLSKQDSIKLDSLCQVYTNKLFSTGFWLMLHPEDMGRYCAIALKDRNLHLMVSFSNSLKGMLRLHRQLSVSLPLEVFRVPANYKRILEQSTEAGQAQLAAACQKITRYERNTRRVPHFRNVTKTTLDTKYPVHERGEYAVVCHSLQKHPFTGRLSLIAEFSRGEAYYKFQTEEMCKEIALLEVKYAVATEIKLT